ncbi:hypothetical protein ONE63_005673 [Megalurothrips usitatus]|uniref:Ionotropic glutamate receptor C-terminal domain-containing protein n=1 Tax=Megalurothrips usitatus TaxID=439358 RepID=A0AAV7Y175_9NEOP|nr:hypothetical protein ONE63_005673 [Megalurothrips usitatus]
MAEQANVNLLVFERDDYGYNKDANGMFDGLMGELQRFECDLLSTAVYVTNERLYILDSVAETFPLRTGVIYKMSSSRSASNIYLEPFSEGVWLAVAAIMAVCTAELVATTRSWATHKPVLISVADCVTAVLGVLCQQGADRTPDSVSGRTVMTMLLLTSFFIFTSFGAFIVALLQAPATPLGSPKELLASPIKISAMDVAFIHAWFRPVRGVVGDIFVKKIKKHERPGFLPVWEGIELVRRRGYGYQAEMNEAYHEIQEKFTETEKCDLFEMELFPSEAQIIVTVEKSPYREVFSRFVRWQRELGLLDRISKRWYASKPRCEPGSRGFQAIGAREVVPLLLLLTYGVLLSLLLLAMEIVSRHRRPRAPPACSPSYWRRLFAGGGPGGRRRRRREDARGRPGRPGPPRPRPRRTDRANAKDTLPVHGDLFWQTRSIAVGHFTSDLLHRKAMVKIDMS